VVSNKTFSVFVEPQLVLDTSQPEDILKGYSPPCKFASATTHDWQPVIG